MDELQVPIVVTLAVGCWVVYRYATTRKWHRWRKGLCPRCGYDLRMHNDRCPECGRRVQWRDEPSGE